MAEFPSGNARRGDYVYAFLNEDAQKAGRVRQARVYSVGVGNPPKNIQIQFGESSQNRHEVSCVDHGGERWPEPRIIIEPSLRELLKTEKDLVDFYYDFDQTTLPKNAILNWEAKLRHNIRVVRLPTNTEQVRYALLCVKCWQQIELVQSQMHPLYVYNQPGSGWFAVPQGGAKTKVEGSCQCEEPFDQKRLPPGCKNFQKPNA